MNLISGCANTRIASNYCKKYNYLTMSTKTFDSIVKTLPRDFKKAWLDNNDLYVKLCTGGNKKL